MKNIISRFKRVTKVTILIGLLLSSYFLSKNRLSKNPSDESPVSDALKTQSVDKSDRSASHATGTTKGTEGFSTESSQEGTSPGTSSKESVRDIRLHSGKDSVLEFPNLNQSTEQFLKFFLPYLLNETPSSAEVMTILKKAGATPFSKITGNDETGKRIEVSLEDESAYGFSKFKLVFQLGEAESFERFIYGRKPQSEKWEEEFSQMKGLLEQALGKEAVSRSQRSGFTTWRLPSQRIVWINNQHESYGEKMILVGFEYEIH